MTVDLGDGSWFNLRTSNTEPLLRLNVEARTTEDVDEVVGTGWPPKSPRRSRHRT